MFCTTLRRARACAGGVFTLSVGNGASGEATNGAIQKLLILVKLHDVIARSRADEKAVPRLLLIQRALRFVASNVIHNCSLCL
jgi:hypothetical protein